MTETITTTATSHDVADAETGLYRILLHAVAWNGALSPGVALAVTTTGWALYRA